MVGDEVDASNNVPSKLIFPPSNFIASKQFFNRSLKKDFLQKLEVVPSKFKK